MLAKKVTIPTTTGTLRTLTERTRTNFAALGLLNARCSLGFSGTSTEADQKATTNHTCPFGKPA